MTTLKQLDRILLPFTFHISSPALMYNIDLKHRFFFTYRQRAGIQLLGEPFRFKFSFLLILRLRLRLRGRSNFVRAILFALGFGGWLNAHNHAVRTGPANGLSRYEKYLEEVEFKSPRDAKFPSIVGNLKYIANFVINIFAMRNLKAIYRTIIFFNA